MPGEIHIGGDGVTHGYLNRAELTAEKFIADPFSRNRTPGCTRPGDLGRFLPDGRIEFQGRADHQVKVRGYRIELGEIETVLGRHPAVQECVVIAREDVDGRQAAGGVCHAGRGSEDRTRAELRAWVKERLPEYMVPVAWVEMDACRCRRTAKSTASNLPAPDYARPIWQASTRERARRPKK